MIEAKVWLVWKAMLTRRSQSLPKVMVLDVMSTALGCAEAGANWAEGRCDNCPEDLFLLDPLLTVLATWKPRKSSWRLSSINGPIMFGWRFGLVRIESVNDISVCNTVLFLYLFETLSTVYLMSDTGIVTIIEKIHWTLLVKLVWIIALPDCLSLCYFVHYEKLTVEHRVSSSGPSAPTATLVSQRNRFDVGRVFVQSLDLKHSYQRFLKWYN